MSSRMSFKAGIKALLLLSLFSLFSISPIPTSLAYEELQSLRLQSQPSQPHPSRLLEICPNPYGDDGSEYVKFYCNSNCTLSDGEGSLKVGRGYYIATKDIESYLEHFKTDTLNATLNATLIEFPPKFALSNKGETVCLNGDCLNYSFYLDDGVVYYRKDGDWDFGYEDWSNFECVNDTVNLTLILTPSDFKLPDGYRVASYTFSAAFTPAELFVYASPFSLPCRELEIQRVCKVHFLHSNSYKVFHYKFAVRNDSVVITTENWIFNKKGFILIFNSSRIGKFLNEVLDNDVRYSGEVPEKCDRWKWKVGEIKGSKSNKSNKIRSSAKISVFVLPDCNPIFDFMGSARKRLVVIAPYMKFDWFGNETSPLKRELIKAVERGVDVRVILNRKYADKNVLRELESMGVKVKLVEGLHGKAVISDDRLLITSANMNKYGLKLNREIGIVIYDAEMPDYVYNHMVSNPPTSPDFDAISTIPVMVSVLLLSMLFKKSSRNW